MVKICIALLREIAYKTTHRAAHEYARASEDIKLQQLSLDCPSFPGHFSHPLISFTLREFCSFGQQAASPAEKASAPLVAPLTVCHTLRYASFAAI